MAADQGYTPAQFNLAEMLENGRGVEKNVPEAIKLYKIASDNGRADAKKKLNYLMKNEVK